MQLVFVLSMVSDSAVQGRLTEEVIAVGYLAVNSASRGLLVEVIGFEVIIREGGWGGGREGEG